MEQTYNRGKLSIISCESGKHFADKVVKRLDEIIKEETENSEISLTDTDEKIFANTEIKTEILDSIRGCDVYIFQDVENHSAKLSVSDNYAALKSAIDAARRSGVQHITAVIPTYPCARQDKPTGREGISAATVAREIEDAGASQVITLDIHNTAIAGFFRIAVLENLKASKELIKYIKNNLDTDNLIVTPTDTGGGARAEYFAEQLEKDMIYMYKKRNYSIQNSVKEVKLLGNVDNLDVLIVEDMVDTAGTLEKAALKLKEEGANKIFIVASLMMFNGKAVEILDRLHSEGVVSKVIGTNVIYKPDNFSQLHPWYAQVNLEKYFARVIYNINQGKSISKLLE